MELGGFSACESHTVVLKQLFVSNLVYNTGMLVNPS